MKQNTLILYLILTSFIRPIYGQLPDSLSQIFNYSKSKPLYVVDSSFIRDNILTEQITYISTDSFRTSALVVHPPNKTKASLLIFQHWGEGDKTEFLEEAITFANQGFICILPDGPWLCPNTTIKSFKRQGFEMYRQCVMNVRTAIDLAERSFEINPKKIFFVGHSFGCNTGAILSAIDNRISAYVFMAGTISSTKNVSNSKQPDFVEWRTDNPAQFKLWIERLKPLDAELYLPFKTKPCLIQVANRDEYISQEENDKFIEVTPFPKIIKKYDSTHFLNHQAREDRMTWILNQNK